MLLTNKNGGKYFNIGCIKGFNMDVFMKNGPTLNMSENIDSLCLQYVMEEDHILVDTLRLI